LFFERFQSIQPGRPLILGHRGCPLRARENSLESFRLAMQSGADGIELDVQPTADGVLVAHHDEHLPSGEDLAALPYDQLKPLAEQAGYELTRVADVFHLVASSSLLLNIELKQPGCEAALIQLAREHLQPDRFAFSSFDVRAVAACRKLAPDVPALLIVWGLRGIHADFSVLENIDASGIAYETAHLTEEHAHFYTARKVPIFVWTVNDRAEAQRVASLKVSGIITDKPAEMVGWFTA
jgi:glycerophosphoryl diester phosphodiesterase